MIDGDSVGVPVRHPALLIMLTCCTLLQEPRRAIYHVCAGAGEGATSPVILLDWGTILEVLSVKRKHSTSACRAAVSNPGVDTDQISDAAASLFDVYTTQMAPAEGCPPASNCPVLEVPHKLYMYLPSTCT